eukprot:2953738-Pleurochrysis_carterae.AAC.7
MDLRLVRLRPQICRSRSIRVDWLVHAPLHLRLMRAARALMLGACVKLGSVLLMRRAAVARAAVVRRLLLLLLHAPLLIVGGGVGAIERGLRLDTGDVLVELEVVVEAALRRLGRVVAQTERAKVRVEAGERVVVGRRGETGRASRALLAVLGRAALEAEDALLRRHRAEQLRGASAEGASAEDASAEDASAEDASAEGATAEDATVTGASAARACCAGACVAEARRQSRAARSRGAGRRECWAPTRVSRGESEASAATAAAARTAAAVVRDAGAGAAGTPAAASAAYAACAACAAPAAHPAGADLHDYTEGRLRIAEDAQQSRRRRRHHAASATTAWPRSGCTVRQAVRESLSTASCAAALPSAAGAGRGAGGAATSRAGYSGR